MGFGLSTDTAHAAETVKGLLSELQRVQDQPIEGADLARAKLNAVAEIVSAEEAGSGSISLLESLAASGLSLRHHEELAQSIERVSEADVQAAAKKYFTTNTVQIAVVGEPSLADSLRALGIGEVRVVRE